MVAQRRADRERDMEEAEPSSTAELAAVNIEAEISGRAKHFYSIYDKMVRKGKEFNEIYDLTALRVLVDSVKDCYAALGVIHSLWKPLPGRFKDYIAMPKFNMYQSLHTTVIGPQGKPLEIQIRTNDMHETAQYGIAAHWMYKEKAGRGGQREAAQVEKLQWLRQIMDWQSETKDAGEFMESLHIDLFHDEVYVFTPKGEVKSLPAGSTPVDFAYAIHTDVGHRCIGAKVDGRIVPLTYRLQSGDIVEILTSKTAQGPSRDWLQFVASSGARNKIRQWFKRERREDAEHLGREALLEAFRKQGLPAQRLIGSDLLAEVMKETNHPKKEDFFIAVGSGKISPQHVVTRVIQSLNREGEGAAAVLSVPGRSPRTPRASPRRASWASVSTASTTWPSAYPSAAVRSRGTTWWGTSLWAAASPSIAATAPTSRPWRRTPSASPPCTGTRRPRRRCGWRSRSRPTIATICWRTSPAPSARAASASSPPRSSRRATTWSRTASCSTCPRSTTWRRSCSASAASTRSTTPTGSRLTDTDRSRAEGAPSRPPSALW